MHDKGTVVKPVGVEGEYAEGVHKQSTPQGGYPQSFERAVLYVSLCQLSISRCGVC
jgi:hypothetical protein